MNDLIGGHVDFFCEQSVSVAEQVLVRRDQGLRACRRPSGWPRCRTCRPPRSSASTIEMSIWAGMFAPKGTPAEIVAKLADALDKALDDASVRERIKPARRLDPRQGRADARRFDRFVKAEIARWAPLLPPRRANPRRQPRRRIA